MTHINHRISRPLVRFFRREDGNMTILALGFFMCMVMIGGFAIDLIRYEADRTRLQNTLDRAALAAASLDQTMDATVVVNEYLSAEGLDGDLQDIDVATTGTSRDVRLLGRRDTQPKFLHMIGIEEFDAVARSGAAQSATKIELSLVLDVSGSMAGQKLTNLKAAASEFVNTVLSADTDERISIALVPYNGQVNLGPNLRARYNVTDLNGVANSDCVDLPASVYGSIGISTTQAMPQTAFVDSFSGTSQPNGYLAANHAHATPNALNRWCPAMAQNIVRLPTRNIAALQANINGLTAIGATSINAGMKWGVTLLDPDTRPVFDALRAQGHIPATLSGRPADWSDPDTMKIVVLMTDGQHFAEERMNEGFRTGDSVIWRATGDTNYSIFHASRVNNASAATICGSRPFWVPHLGVWHSRPWNGAAPVATACYTPGAVTTSVAQQTWQQVWANQRVSWVAWQLYARALGTDAASRTARYNAAMAMFRTQTDTTTMDSQLQSICDQAEAQEIVVYGIAFEAPAGGQAQIEGCASSSSHYFDAQGLEIATAFRTIATNLTMLKLTQ